MIIDSHVHFGHSAWGNFSPEFLLEILGDSIDFAICSNLEGIESTDFKGELECNLKMVEISRKYKKLKPLIVCQPNITEDAEVVRFLLDNCSEFIGLKFHPECMKLPADSDKYDKYLKLAREYKKPCLFHAGHMKSRFSSPKLIYKKAQEFPDVPIILGHLSTGPKNCHVEAIELLLDSIEYNKAKLYVDTSWIDFAFEELNENMDDTIMLVERLKSTKVGDATERILWATDCPVGKFNHSKASYARNLEVFSRKVLEKFEDEGLLKNLLFNNAKKLYSL